MVLLLKLSLIEMWEGSQLLMATRANLGLFILLISHESFFLLTNYSRTGSLSEIDDQEPKRES